MDRDLQTVIRVEGLVNRFGRQVVHDHLNLEVQRDEILAIVGGSGAGKSVLLRSILGLHQPNEGRIEVLGQEIRFHKPGPVRQWGVLFQGGALLSGLTVQENVELPIALYSDLPVETRRELATLKSIPASCPAACANVQRWRAPWHSNRACCSWMSPPPGWIRSQPPSSTA